MSYERHFISLVHGPFSPLLPGSQILEAVGTVDTINGLDGHYGPFLEDLVEAASARSNEAEVWALYQW